jgi:hypothetical protein
MNDKIALALWKQGMIQRVNSQNEAIFSCGCRCGQVMSNGEPARQLCTRHAPTIRRVVTEPNPHYIPLAEWEIKELLQIVNDPEAYEYTEKEAQLLSVRLHPKSASN